MRELAYHLLDVFTDVPFGGNQLAVFLDGTGITPEMMQRIARELNLSETVFVLPPQDTANHFRLRIFTPGAELPFAGHPTIGTGFLLYQQGLIPAGEAIRLEEGVGVIPITVALQADGRASVTMQQPVPQFGPVFEDRAAIAATLSLTDADLIPELPVQMVSSGVPFLFIPVRTLDAVRRIKVRLDLWEQYLKNSVAPSMFVFTPQVEREGSTVHSRMFAPNMGIAEDPATGGASGPLGAYLLRYGLVPVEKADSIISEQGIEMGRASFIHISVSGTPDHITGASISGFSQRVGAGVLFVPDHL